MQDPRPPPPPKEPASGIDVVIVFDINDELCIKRACGRTCELQKYFLIIFVINSFILKSFLALLHNIAAIVTVMS